MQRPIEYENMIKQSAFEVVKPTPGAIEGYIGNASNYLKSARQIDQNLSLQIFTCAYEGYFQLVQAVLEFYQVRTKEAGRNAAILRVCADLKMDPTEIAFVSRAHARRNATSYQSPFPPVSRKEADQLLAILAKYIRVAQQLVNQSATPTAAS